MVWSTKGWMMYWFCSVQEKWTYWWEDYCHCENWQESLDRWNHFSFQFQKVSVNFSPEFSYIRTPCLAFSSIFYQSINQCLPFWSVAERSIVLLLPAIRRKILLLTAIPMLLMTTMTMIHYHRYRYDQWKRYCIQKKKSHLVPNRNLPNRNNRSRKRRRRREKRKMRSRTKQEESCWTPWRKPKLTALPLKDSI